ncbi:hypothetical protein GNF10_35355 [Nostoc sp. UCD121]|uniref:hypothetical protein n=1 Tax=Nostoc sp. UCD121 TaxID=2681305 RepID=UPI001624E693|nr:hypothetical protein [Nostoc sp. UCD121]MBC1281064.1 hypothetical protein [Nostoc sp. UCD121]
MGSRGCLRCRSHAVGYDLYSVGIAVIVPYAVDKLIKQSLQLLRTEPLTFYLKVRLYLNNDCRLKAIALPGCASNSYHQPRLR